MSLDVTLFVLRVISASLLIIMMLVIFIVLWRDYQSTLQKVESNRRTYGHLVALQFLDGSYVMLGEVYPLLPLTSLGRAPTNTIVIKDTFASSEHALLMLRNGQWWLEDRHSRNGTTLNEHPVTQATVITSGDVIGIGQKRFRIELER